MADNILTQDYLKSIFEYRDGELCWKIKFVDKVTVGDKAGGIDCSTNYKRVKIHRKTYALHRLIFLFNHGYLPKQVDHIDGNRSNNKIENLREASSSQNSHNQKLRVTNTSSIKNVSWSKVRKKWNVSLMVNYKRIILGFFNDIELAELVSIEAREIYHGDFARHK